METNEVIKIQSFKLELLIELYKKAKGLQTYYFRDVETIHQFFPEVTEDGVISALLFLEEENYISFIDASDMNGIDMMQIKLRSKGIRLAESILLQGKIDQFETDFSLQTINYYYHIHDIDNTSIIVGDENNLLR